MIIPCLDELRLIDDACENRLVKTPFCNAHHVPGWKAAAFIAGIKLLHNQSTRKRLDDADARRCNDLITLLDSVEQTFERTFGQNEISVHQDDERPQPVFSQISDALGKRESQRYAIGYCPLGGKEFVDGDRSDRYMVGEIIEDLIIHQKGEVL